MNESSSESGTSIPKRLPHSEGTSAWRRGRTPLPASLAVLAGMLAAAPWPLSAGLAFRLAAVWFLVVPLLSIGSEVFAEPPKGSPAARHREGLAMVGLAIVLAGLLGATPLVLYAFGLSILFLSRRASGAHASAVSAGRQILLPGLLAFIVGGGAAPLSSSLRIQSGPIGELAAWLSLNGWVLILLVAASAAFAALAAAAESPSRPAMALVHAAYLVALVPLLWLDLPWAAGALAMLYVLQWPILLGLKGVDSAAAARLASRFGGVVLLLTAAAIGLAR